MAWIESHQSIAAHPKTKRLARLLAVSVPLAIGHLHLLWWWTLDYAPDGDLSRYTPDDIADGCQWAGDADALVSALVTSGFVDEVSAGCPADVHGQQNVQRSLVVHDWYEYAGKYAERRRSDAARKRAARTDASSISASRPADIQRTSGGRRAESVVTNQPTNRSEISRSTGGPPPVNGTRPRLYRGIPEISATPEELAGIAEANGGY